MHFTGFHPIDFETFTIEGLDARMEAIRTNIQPKFHQISDDLLDEMTVLSEQEMFFHYAKHLRRTVNPPKDTWMAFCDNKRGYKQHPHFQIGLYDDRVFVWLAYLYEIPNKRNIATKLIENLAKIDKLIPNNYFLSFDHLKKDAVTYQTLNKDDLKSHLESFRDVKKTDLLIGKQISFTEPVLQKPEEFIKLVRDTFQTLMPIYRMTLV